MTILIGLGQHFDIALFGRFFVGVARMSSISISPSVDVPNLADGVRFYINAFGFSKHTEPVPEVAVLRAGDAQLCLLEKQAGSQPSQFTHETRHNERHWTPGHMNIHVDDLEIALAKDLDADVTQEQIFENPEHGSVAFRSVPFSHGFCLIEKRR
jgi:Glyoxalase-like domain